MRSPSLVVAQISTEHYFSISGTLG